VARDLARLSVLGNRLATDVVIARALHGGPGAPSR